MHNVTPVKCEDETTDLSAATSAEKNKEQKSCRYQCPADFVSFCHNPCDSILKSSLKKHNSELWLIKAPNNFDPKCFSGVTVPLSGLQTLQVPNASGRAGGGGAPQVYSTLASTQGASELCILTRRKRTSKEVMLGPTFSGLINICESFGDISTNQAPQVIPASLPPTIPPGLKQRFQAFGSKTPTLTCVAESKVDALGSSSATLLPGVLKQEEAEERKKRKKRKRDKTDSEVKLQEENVVVRVKQEPSVFTPDLDESMEITSQEAEVTEEKRKKKKKKKDKERGEKEEIVVAHDGVKEENIEVNCEPMDSSCGDLQGSSKKKKKKNKSKHGDD